MSEYIEIEGVHLLGCNGINDRRDDFDEFYENLKLWIKAKSNIFLRYPRLARAKTYYEAVDKFGWSVFADCRGIK